MDEIDQSTPTFSTHVNRFTSSVFWEFEGLAEVEEDLRRGSFIGEINDRWVTSITMDDSDGLVLKLGLCPCLSDPGLYDLDNVYSLRVMVYATLAAERFPMHRGKWVEVPDAAHVHEGVFSRDEIFGDSRHITEDRVTIQIEIVEDVFVHQGMRMSDITSSRFASHLLDPCFGDTVILVHNREGLSECLYAWQWALERCEFFAAIFRWKNIQKSAGISRTEDVTATMTFANPTLLPSDLNDRIIIRLDDPRDDIDFVTLHNFLYYMHTGSVNLIFEQDKIPALIHPKGFPKKADAFDLYRIADRCLVEGLKDYCYRFIEATTTASNVAERLSHLRCEHDDALRNLLHKIACTFDCVPSVPPHSPDGIESKKKRKLEV